MKYGNKEAIKGFFTLLNHTLYHCFFEMYTIYFNY